jgi:chemotaxis protein methyltransferase CheR
VTARPLPTTWYQSTIERQLGRTLGLEQSARLPRLIKERSRKLRLSPNDYVARLVEGKLEGETQAIAAEFTIGESYFFRDLPQLNNCVAVIGQLLRDHPNRPVRVLSAGSSTGEEPFSLAVLLAEQLGSSHHVHIYAIDLNATAIESARRGRYSAWSLRETPEHLQAQWFRQDGKHFKIAPEIVQRVQFTRASLSVDGPALAHHGYDVILCRNVLMYFSPEQYAQATRRLWNALTPDGYLFLGHAESLRGCDVAATTVQFEEGYCYKKGASEMRPRWSVPSPPAGPRLAQAGDASSVELVASDAGAAVATLTPAVSHEAPPRELATLKRLGVLVKAERYSDALAALDTAELDSTPATRTARVILLVYTNHFEEARALASELVASSAESAELHYALTLCDEAASNLEQAAEHARRATYLDPTFSLPWLHLGILNRKLKHFRAARKELLQARALLTVDAPERLSWFGGGCSRATLLEACQREITATGEHA